MKRSMEVDGTADEGRRLRGEVNRFRNRDEEGAVNRGGDDRAREATIDFVKMEGKREEYSSGHVEAGEEILIGKGAFARIGGKTGIWETVSPGRGIDREGIDSPDREEKTEFEPERRGHGRGRGEAAGKGEMRGIVAIVEEDVFRGWKGLQVRVEDG